MKRFLITVWTVWLMLAVHGQQADTLTLEECLRAVTLNSPVNRQKSLDQEVLISKIKNLNTNWLPAVGLNALASYNSETTDFSDVIGGGGFPVSIPSLPLDQYKVWAELNQQLFDGGATKAQKNMEKAGSRSDLNQSEMDMLNSRQQTAQVYFSLLLTRKNSEIIAVSLGELGERKKIIQSGISNGVILQDNMLAMDAQEISLMQKITELKITEGQLINVLRILTDSNISSNLVIAEPPEINLNGSNSSRPEYSLFQNQKEKLDAGIQLVASADLPRLYAFSQFAYGRPGYNIVSRDFHTFYTVGAAAKWNILGWGENRRQIRILELQKEMIDVKKDLFDDRLNIQLEKERYDIVKYDSLINQDIEIVRLRKAITVSAMSRLNNGVITATDFLTDMNAEIVASLQLENHRILKLQATYNYAIMQGNY